MNRSLCRHAQHCFRRRNEAGIVVSSPAIERKNKLYFGDNLSVLREYVADASVDPIYLDPPFNSNADYNVLSKEKGGEESGNLDQLCTVKDWRATPSLVKYLPWM